MKINNEIIYNKKEGIEYIQFKKLLEFGVKHAYTLKGENIDFSNNSEYEKSSYEKIFKALDLNINTLVKPLQTHTCNVKCIDRIYTQLELENIDGLITNTRNIALSTTNADCILFLFYDPLKKVMANIHSGWKGTFQKIAEKAIVKMINYYDSNPKDIFCFISPSIRKCHFEVDEEVKDLCKYIFKFTKKENEFIKIGEIKNGIQKYMIDTVLLNKILFEEIGIKKENIIDCELCSVCNSDKISSYRVEGKKFKRATLISSL